MKNEGSNNASGFGVFSKIKLIATSLIVGLALGATGILLFNAHNVDEESQDLEASAVFERIIQQNTMITASQRYQIVDKVSDENEILGSIKVPFTENSFWYRFAGTIQAGVDLDKIVDEQHAHGVADIDRRSRVFGQYQRQERHMPTVLGAVFAPAAVGQRVLAQNALEAVDFDDERQLPV